jgi:hypothetical protein
MRTEGVEEGGYCSCNVAMDVLSYFNLAAILEYTYFRFRSMNE